MTTKTLSDMQEEAARYLTGGISSSFRANFYTGIPMYASSARGPRFTDCTGKEYIDFFMCHGAVLLGHDRPEVRTALHNVIDKGYYAGFDDSSTIEFARKICDCVPVAERIRFVNSGTEGTLLALRLARGFTNRELIVRMDGHFHGCQDYLFANNLSGKIDRTNDGTHRSKTIGRTAGVPKAVDDLVITVPWNRPEILKTVLKEEEGRVAAVIMNIIDYNNGVFTTTAEYLRFVRSLTEQYGTVLIFDEVLSGFKTGLSCGQGYYGVTPDLCTLGKALTNDVPLGVVAGKKSIMDKIMDPENPVIAGGTFSGNQFGVAAGNAALEVLSKPGFYTDFFQKTDPFYHNIEKIFQNRGLPATVQHLGAGFHIFLGTEGPLENYNDLQHVDRELTRKFFSACIDRGLYFHTDFTVSAAHDETILNEALNRMDDAAESIRSK